MNTPEDSATVWYVPAIVMKLAGGEFLVKTGKPIMRTTAKQTSKLTGISLKNLRILAEAGFIRCARPTPGTAFFYPAEVEAFIQRTEAEPDFWNKVRLAAYLPCARLRNSRKNQP